MAQQRSSKKTKPAVRRKVIRTEAPAVSDPIADMLTRIRNAAMARHVDVNIPVSKIKMEIASILHREGYIRGFQLVDRGKIIRIRLKYDANRRPVINGLKRVSRPGRRVYVGRERLPRVQNGLGVAILTTSQGIMTAREAARAGIGGEVIGYVW
jgi:small subunit ribosomal protein S8